MVSDQKLCTCIGELTIKLSYICLAAIGLEMCDTTMRILLPVLCNRYIESLVHREPLGCSLVQNTI